VLVGQRSQGARRRMATLAVLKHGDRCTHGRLRGCSGQGKMDTALSHLPKCFVCIGADIPPIRMLPPTGVEHLNIIDHVIAGFLPCRGIPMRHTFALHAAQKPRRHGMVSTRSLATPTTLDSMVRQKPPVGMTGVLRTTITMVQATGGQRATTEGHRQRLRHQWRSSMSAHGPPPPLSSHTRRKGLPHPTSLPRSIHRC
jgi:hypothetical protein